MNYLSVSQMAKKWNMSERGVRKYCAEDKIPGAFLTGKTWNIPENAEKTKRKNKKSKDDGDGFFVYYCFLYSNWCKENN